MVVVHKLSHAEFGPHFIIHGENIHDVFDDVSDIDFNRHTYTAYNILNIQNMSHHHRINMAHRP